jgi:transposase
MIDFMKKLDIIHLKRNGCSNREVARKLKIDRKTVARYWNRYLSEVQKLKDPDMDAKEVQEQIVSKPKYDSSQRAKVKYTEKMDLRLKYILSKEIEKDKLLGNHKQSLTKKQIHEKLLSEGFDISYSTITVQINKILKSAKECFIWQKYDLGDRLEYDFGEVKLHINGETKDYHMAVLSSPSGEFRWAYLYRNQKKDVFLDSHVKFFEMAGGVYKEVVYDNMRM